MYSRGGPGPIDMSGRERASAGAHVVTAQTSLILRCFEVLPVIEREQPDPNLITPRWRSVLAAHGYPQRRRGAEGLVSPVLAEVSFGVLHAVYSSSRDVGSGAVRHDP